MIQIFFFKEKSRPSLKQIIFMQIVGHQDVTVWKIMTVARYEKQTLRYVQYILPEFQVSEAKIWT